MNKVILIGRVGKDPEVKVFDNNTTVAKFSLATSETYKDKKGQKQTTTEWHNIVVFGPRAEIVEKYVKKGQLISIEGKIKTRAWEDKDKVKRYTTEINVDSVQILSAKEGEKTSKPAQVVDDEPNDLPF